MSVLVKTEPVRKLKKQSSQPLGDTGKPPKMACFVQQDTMLMKML